MGIGLAGSIRMVYEYSNTPSTTSSQDVFRPGMFESHGLGLLLPALLRVGNGCPHESEEEGLRAKWTTRQFGMRLRTQKIRVDVLRQLQHLHDRLGRVLAAEDHPVLFERGNVFGIDLEAVAETQSDAGL